MPDTTTPKPFHLDFANRVIEHLGVKLYQNRPTNVVAEFVSNSWDADAGEVIVDLLAEPGTATRTRIVVTDNGRGMTREEITDAFLIIGHNRRGTTPGSKTVANRNPMGRKGIGKLAGFGIAKVIDLVSIPNPELRGSGTEAKVYWLRFKLADMVGNAGYDPEALLDGATVEEFERKLTETGDAEIFKCLLQNAKTGKGGVSVFMRDSSLKKAIDPDALLRELGRRFTVTMLRNDFIVKVEGKRISPADAFPPFQDFAIGSAESPQTETVTFDGIPRELRYWAKFVSLSDAEWPIENAGVGVYTHGKIAQDRPFFFGVRGKEILSRYLYAVVEADWLDEMPEDVVSTDRRSINWETDATDDFHKWGARKTSEWLEDFRKWRASADKISTVERIRASAPGTRLSGPEESALADLLADVLPNLGNNEDAKNKATTSFTQAWTHAPTRKLTKALWEKVFSSNAEAADAFPIILQQLQESLVPEALGLAVTVGSIPDS